MKEEVLHYLWKFQLLDGHLFAADGLPITVIKPGLHNTDSGPDFVDARIQIGDTMWAGNVEIHIHASSWHDHHHHTDQAYDNVILHVVVDNDRQIKRTDGQLIPTLVCDKHINRQFYARYKQLMESRLWVPCVRLIKDCPPFITASWLSTLMVERLHQKSTEMEEVLKNTKYDWEETFYRFVARSLGLKINTLPFELLASSLPQKILAKHRDRPLQIEALLFGQAGFLQKDVAEPYPTTLKREYEFLRKKYNLQPIENSLWKFMRLRPTSFPTVRIAIIAKLMASHALFSKVIESTRAEQLRQLFNVEVSDYWSDHFRFGIISKTHRNKKLGVQSVDLLLINTVIPMLFLFGRYHGNQDLMDRAIHFLESMPAEENNITRKWTDLGIRISDAATSQALLHLKKWYCTPKKCLTCRIGNELLRKGSS
ncbi:MAG: DUF2851 family protein [Bacteroidales bacterium]|nr:DUF2851 family protein [Bacteroidales bacterium]MDZ4204025.1 DUF2851 family protein [Bacteroidales bacterium]